MSHPARSLKAVFIEALNHAPGPERSDYLDLACSGDAALRDRVEALLRAHEVAGSFLDKPNARGTDPDESPSLSATGGTGRNDTDDSPPHAAVSREGNLHSASPVTEGVASNTPRSSLIMTGPPLTDTSTGAADIGGNGGNATAPGTRVRYFGDYELLEEVGRGGIGVVYKARQISLNRLVALKMLRANVLAGDNEQRRFQNEAEAVALLDHPHIVPIFEVGEHAGLFYFSMKLISGASLDTMLAGYAADPRAAAELVIKASEAVHHAHQRGILHRDLKPSNIVIDDRGKPYVTDFGLAKRIGGRSELTHSGVILGTPAYMSPEQASARPDAVTTASDVYGLGAVLYALLTGRAPFVAASIAEILQRVREDAPESPSRFNPQTERDLEVIALKCLEKAPRRRYESAQALAYELHRYLAGEPITARPSGAAERVWKWIQRRPAVAALVAVSVTAALLFVVTLAVGNVVISRRQAATERALESERRVSYLQRIGLAAAAIRADQVARADVALDECPPDLRRWEWGYLKRLAHAERASWTGHPGGMSALAFQPDGLRLAAGGELWTVDGEPTWEQADVRIYDVVTGREAARLEVPGPWRVTAVRYSPDGRRLAVASLSVGDIRDQDPGGVYVFDAAGGAPMVEIKGDREADRGMFLDVAFCPDGAWLAVSNSEGVVKLCDAATGLVLRRMTGHEGGVTGVAFRPDGAALATSGEDGTVRLWDAATGHSLRLLKGHRGAVNGVAFRPDGHRLATAGEDRTIRIWDPETSRDLRVIWGHNDAVSRVAFSPDGTRIASCGQDGTVRVWDPESGQELAVYHGHNRHVRALAFHPDGRTLATTGDDGTVKLWDLTTPPQYRILSGHQWPVGALAFSPDGTRLASLGVVDRFDHGGELRIWEVSSGRPLLNLSEETPMSLAYGPATGDLITAGISRRVNFRDAADGHVRLSLEGSLEFTSVAVSPDGKIIATGTQDEVAAVDLRDTATGGVLRRLAAPEKRSRRVAALTALTFSPDGRTIVGCWGNDYEWQELGAGRCWDVVTGRVMWTNLGGTEGYHDLAFLPDGRGIVAAAGRAQDSVRPGEVVIWDAIDGHTVRRLRGHAGAVLAVTITPDGSRIASAGLDHLVKIWDTSTGTEVLTLSGHDGPVRALAFRPNGHSLASGGEDRVIRLWEAIPQALETAAAQP